MGRFAIFGALAVIAAALTSCAAEGSDKPGAAPGVNTIQVEMLDNAFRPNVISVPAAATVTFELPNKGKLPHNMHIASARGIYRESPWLSEPPVTTAGERGRLAWEVPDQPGLYKFRCDFHEVEMTGTLRVE